MLLMVLLGTGSASLVSLGKELCALDPQELEESFTLGEDARIARGLARCERALQGPEGREYELYRALQAHSDPTAQVFLIGPDPHRSLSAQSHLRILLHPRVVWLLDRLPTAWETKARAMRGSVYIVDYDNTPALGLEESCKLLLDKRGIRLWKFEKR